jgi:hypothetical protein
MPSQLPLVLLGQDYTLLLAKNGDVWFCGESTVSGMQRALPFKVDAG